MGEGANAILFWEASDQTWSTGDFGMINSQGQAKPVAAAMKIAFDSLPWDIPVVEAKGAGSDIVAIAFRIPAGIRVDLVNLTPSPHLIHATFQGLNLSSGGLRNIQVFDAQAGKHASANQPVFNDGILTDDLPGRTLVSFLLE